MIERQILKNVFIGTLSTLLFLAGSGAWAVTESFLDGYTGNGSSLTTLINQLRPGAVLIIGEQHGFTVHQRQQLQVIKTTQENRLFASVGMEFFSYTGQPAVDSWRQGLMKESQMLTGVEWQGISFDFYRPQVQLPRWGIEYVQALNAPKIITHKVGQQGLDSLTPEEKALLPPQFQVGNDRYFERFKEVAGTHCPNLANCFLAQSIWDDTMAWQASEFLRQHPEQTLIIIVGEFHVQYGGGLPDRLKARGVKDVFTLSLLNLDGTSQTEAEEMIKPSPIDGRRADYIWTSR